MAAELFAARKRQPSLQGRIHGVFNGYYLDFRHKFKGKLYAVALAKRINTVTHYE